MQRGVDDRLLAFFEALWARLPSSERGFCPFAGNTPTVLGVKVWQPVLLHKWATLHIRPPACPTSLPHCLEKLVAVRRWLSSGREMGARQRLAEARKCSIVGVWQPNLERGQPTPTGEI